MKVVPIVCKYTPDGVADNIYEVDKTDYDCHARTYKNCLECSSSPDCFCPQKLKGKDGRRFYLHEDAGIDRL